MKRPARLPSAAIVSIIDAVFTRILKPWYGQPSWETVKLYEEHDPRPLFPSLHIDFSESPALRGDHDAGIVPMNATAPGRAAR